MTMKVPLNNSGVLRCKKVNVDIIFGYIIIFVKGSNGGYGTRMVDMR